MTRLNIHEAKTHLSKYLAKLKKGQTIVLCRRNTPVAEIRLLEGTRSKPRPLGVGRGTMTIKPGFHEPLVEEELDAFDGRGA
ncbi:MAG: type II toxin-antitoxin system Phd/YefM family antitoxin [Betaproteobacteria bacterium]